jgi:flagellar hook protein FlgE
MIGALWTGISGLASQQQALDNESNNIANVNTVGFKASRISFADQMYQDKIGKGSKVLDAEKIYEQGNLKLTGVSYDMALSGTGFFTVADKSSTGTSETLYTRAGNFRMGDNGTLQDAAGNEVQGWMMTSIDTQVDVSSSNPNVSTFTSDYTSLLSSKIIKHSTYIETITAKATDYTSSAASDAETIFSGYGLKTQSAKIGDIEAAISDYSSWLQKLSEDPDGASATSTAQQSQVNFKSGNDANLSKEGDQVYVVIDGEKISQSFIDTTATTDQVTLFTAGAALATPTFADQNNDGTIDTADHDLAASRIATYKALADKISEKTGIVAYMAKEGNANSTNNDVLQLDEGFTASTEDLEMLKGILTIKSLIPGQEFNITEIGEESGVTKLEGSFQTSVSAAEGSGMGAVTSAKDALSKLVTGKQRDVFTTSDLNLSTTAADNDYRLNITIFDKDLGKSIPVPNDGSTIPQAVDIDIADVSDIDDFITKFEAALDSTGAGTSPAITDYVEALNINGNLVIRTKDDNFDVDFNTALKWDDPSVAGVAFQPLDKNNDYSGREGAGAEFIEIINKVDQTATKGSLQLRLDTLGISDSAFGEFAVDSSGVISMTQDGAEFAIGQIAIALFNNNRGLEPSGDNLLKASTESGEAIFNLNNDKTGNIEGQTLELSTADLSESLVNLMVFQRAFEANAKSITSSDSLLNTLINLKR